MRFAMNGSGHHNGICVLTFHRVVGTCERDHDITRQSFRSLLDMAVRSGVSTETQLASGTSLQKFSVALTFDDGTVDHVWVGEELARRGIVGIFFVTPGKVGTVGYLSFPEVLELHALGHVVGSHSFNHIPLHQAMSRQQMQTELGDSKTYLEDALGSDVSYFAPPGGIGYRWLGREIDRFGYQASRSMVWGMYRSLGQRWTIPCVPVTEFTLARGWVRAVLSAHALPLSMKSAWTIKSIAPGRARASVRGMLHRAFKPAGSPPRSI